MTLVDSSRQALAGMQKIEQAIIEAVRARKVAIGARNFSWNYGGSLTELPDPVHMEVRAGGRRTSTDWLQVCLKDSGERIERSDVHQEIERVVETLALQR